MIVNQSINRTLIDGNLLSQGHSISRVIDDVYALINAKGLFFNVDQWRLVLVESKEEWLVNNDNEQLAAAAAGAMCDSSI